MKQQDGRRKQKNTAQATGAEKERRKLDRDWQQIQSYLSKQQKRSSSGAGGESSAKKSRDSS